MDDGRSVVRDGYQLFGFDHAGGRRRLPGVCDHGGTAGGQLQMQAFAVPDIVRGVIHFADHGGIVILAGHVQAAVRVSEAILPPQLEHRNPVRYAVIASKVRLGQFAGGSGNG
ncbi:hypothetical protein D1872_234710 [compost metagenome]